MDLVGYYPKLVRQGIVRGIDFNMLAKRFWKLEALRATGELPYIRFRAGNGSFVTGRAFGGCDTQYLPGSGFRRRIVLTIGHNADLDDAIETLLHELVHSSCPQRTHHGELFMRRLIACAREAFGLTLDTIALLNLDVGNHSRRAYAIDRAIRDAMRAVSVGKLLQVDPDLRFEPPPPETEQQLVERRAAARTKLVDERATHAREMLATWERKEKHAHRLAAKWRRKVRYYERKS